MIDSLKAEDQKPAGLSDSRQAETAFKAVTRSNFPLVKKILDTYGFPGYDLVGKSSSNAYWLLVQHSDFDLAFQKKALALMLVQVKNKNASGQAYAFLYDRVLINSGQKQLYGTQITMTESGYIAKPISDPEKVDERRREFGMQSLSEYLANANEAYREMNKGRTPITKDTTKH